MESFQNAAHPWQGFDVDVSIRLQNVQESPRYPLPDFCLTKQRKRCSDLESDFEQQPKKKSKRGTPNVVDMDKMRHSIPSLKAWISRKSDAVEDNETAACIDTSITQLRVNLPRNAWTSSAFEISTDRDNENRVTLKTKNLRVVFIPSHKRQDKDWSFFETASTTTIYIIVVRPSMFESYVKKLGSLFPIIELPQGKGTIGFARHWIMRIAKCLDLKRIWMVDDNICWCKEYKPKVSEGIFIQKDPDGAKKTNLITNEICFELIEDVFSKNKDKDVVAISPRSKGRFPNIKTEFSRKAPQCMIYLDVEKIFQKKINFDKDLPYFEDIIFAAECENADLKVCTWNRILFCKRPYTGVCNPYRYTNY